MADISKIKLPSGNTYDLKDNNALPLTGGSVTGPVSFGDSVTIDEATVGDLVVNGSGSFTNGVKATNYSGGQPVYTVIGTQTTATGSWTGNIDAPALYDGMEILYYLPYAGSGNATLNLTLSNGTTTGAIDCYYNTSGLTTHYGAGCCFHMTYWSAGSIKISGTATTAARWIAEAQYNSDYTVSYSWTAAATAAKVFNANYFYSTTTKQWFHLCLIYGNTYAGAITFNINSQGAKPVYINGAASSSSNYSLTGGWYTVYWDGTNFYVRTDGKITGDITGDAQTVSGHTVGINVPSNAVFTDSTVSTLTLAAGSTAGTALSYGGKYTLTAGTKTVSFTMPASDNTNTTYTFANGTNGFTVTPSGGTAQTVTVTPSITNNITGSGTSGYLAKFNGANTITNGPALGSATTTYLRNDGSWATPTDTNTTYSLSGALSSHKFTSTLTAGGSGSGTSTSDFTLVAGTGISITDDTTNRKMTIACTVSDTDTKVTQTATDSSEYGYPLLFSGTGDNTTRTEGARKSQYLYYHPFTKTLTVGNAVFASTFVGNALSRHYDSNGDVDYQLGLYDDHITLVKNSYSVSLQFTTPTANRTITFPDSTGTVALTSQIPSIPTVPTITLNGSSSTSPSFYAPTGAGTSGYFLKSSGSGAPTWTSIATTDVNVTQAYSTTDANYPLLATATSGISSTSSRGATTSILNNAIYINPSTGNLYANNIFEPTYGSIYGVSSSVTLSTSNKKIMLTTTDFNQNCSLSSGGIKVNTAGTYIIEGSAYFTIGFTANDIVHLLIYVGSTAKIDITRKMAASPYEVMSTGQVMVQLNANDVVYLYARNQTGARGTLATASTTKITLYRIA